MENSEISSAATSKKQRYRKDKPWDTDDIDKWKLTDIKPEDHPYPFTEESSFATLFPKYRENYLRQVWPQVTQDLGKVGIACELDLIEGSMTVKTTRKTWDPYMILKARDLIKLLSRSVPFNQAIRILDPEMNCEIVKIGNIVRNKERFIKRRQRLIGPNGNTLKALELLTGCYVLVQGNTVAIMGSFLGLKNVRRVVLDCMNNIHPIYHIKELMIKRELAKDETLKDENWARFLPKFEKTSKKMSETRKTELELRKEEEKERKMREMEKKKIGKKQHALKKKEYTPFPPPQTPRKIDLQIESGEYFMTKQEKIGRDMQSKKERQFEKDQIKRKEKSLLFVPPQEGTNGNNKKNKTKGNEGRSEMTVDELKQKILSRKLPSQ